MRVTIKFAIISNFQDYAANFLHRIQLRSTRTFYTIPPLWRSVRVAEGARLESVYTATYRGFESLLLRQIKHQ